MKSLTLALALMTAACGGSSTNGTSSGGGSSSGASSGGASSGSFPAKSLAGTWDIVVGSGARADGTGTITIGNNTFLFDVQGFHLNINVANAAPDVTYTYAAGSSTYNGPLTATHTPGSMSLGVLPLSIGGVWVFAGQSQERCNGEGRPDSVSINCTGIGSPLEPLRGTGGAAGITTAQRRSQLSSIFGDLGGAWNVVTPKATCDVTFQDNLFSASCTQGGSQGSVNLTFNEGLASGKTSGGAELSAKRR